jgi:hypothetical protein
LGAARGEERPPRPIKNQPGNFHDFFLIALKMSLTGLWRRALYFEEWLGGSAPVLHVPKRTFENLLYTIRDTDVEPYKVQPMISDCREAWVADPLRPMRRCADELQFQWQDVYKPGCSMVVDESMIGWTGAKNVHITVLSNKPTDKGECSKTPCDACAHVMLAKEFSHSTYQMYDNKYLVFVL